MRDRLGENGRIERLDVKDPELLLLRLCWDGRGRLRLDLVLCRDWLR